jgi:hypothetical protein
MRSDNLIEHRLKNLASDEAATLLMATFPVESAGYSGAFRVMSHRSWKRPDQVRLARFYLQKMPYASAMPYEILSSFMALPALIAVLRERLPADSDDRQLVAYHLIPALTKNIRSERDRIAVDYLSDELRLSAQS